MKYGAAFILAALAISSPAAAEIRTPAKVRYETQDGQSSWYKMQVSFLTGEELNEKTQSYRYSSYSGYAVIFFGQGQAAVIKLRNTMIGCGNEYTVQCLPSFGNARGEDQDGTPWEICTGSFC